MDSRGCIDPFWIITIAAFIWGSLIIISPRKNKQLAEPVKITEPYWVPEGILNAGE